MRDLVIGDVHFGIKSNAVSWLDSQLKFFRDQIFPVIKSDKSIDRIIFLGDVFDIRYSINQQVGIEVKKLIRELSDIFPNNIYFIAGNHDYYSPVEEFDEYNAYELVFGYEFTKCHPNIIIINREPLFENGTLFLPWYYTDNYEKFSDILYVYGKNEIKTIYCHADLSSWTNARALSLEGITVYSGHIHYIVENKENNWYNIGACCALTFNDVNCSRYIYIIEDNKIINKIENKTTKRFNRFYNEDIFTLNGDDFKNAETQICIFNSNINKANYIDKLRELKNTYCLNSNIKIQIINDDISDILELAYFNADVNQFIDENVPEYLSDKYELVKQKVKDSLNNDDKNEIIATEDEN